MTADGRAAEFTVDPEEGGIVSMQAAGRGAYSSERDELTVCDAFGFFAARRFFAAEREPRLYVLPETARLVFDRRPRSGGAVFREEPTLSRTEELTDNRKYAPGDDPRRINWKLYGHSGELFVRDGDPEPPPRARYAVLIDSSVDGRLFPAPYGNAAVDTLAAFALGLAADFLAAGLEVASGGLGLEPVYGDLKETSRSYARAAASPMGAAGEIMGIADPGVRTVVLALPRAVSGDSALARFLASRSAVASPVELLFHGAFAFGAEPSSNGRLGRLFFKSPPVSRWPDPIALAAALDECVRVFDGKGGAHARRLEI